MDSRLWKGLPIQGVVLQLAHPSRGLLLHPSVA